MMIGISFLLTMFLLGICGEVNGARLRDSILQLDDVGLNGKIKVQLPGSRRTLTICELEAYDSDGQRIPLSNAKQSSSWTPASVAIDGNTGQTWASGSCTHSNDEPNPWWEADYYGNRKINKIKVFNRVDCCSERLQGAVVYVDGQKFCTLDGTKPIYECNGGGSSPPCTGYFCGKKLNKIFIIMTHNSYSVDGEVGGVVSNQERSIIRQLNDGVRGLNLDVYGLKEAAIPGYYEKGGCAHIALRHGDKDFIGNVLSGYVNYAEKVDEVVKWLELHPHEFLVVQLEDYVKCGKIGISLMAAMWKGKLIRNFDKTRTLDEYFKLGQQVLLVTDNQDNVDAGEGIHNTKDIFVENEYKWTTQVHQMPISYRRGPKDDNDAASLMSRFVSFSTLLPSKAETWAVQVKDRMMLDVRRFLAQPDFHKRINVMIVDFYNIGDTFKVQGLIRGGDYQAGCWNRGSLCGIGTTCWKCCEPNSYWYEKAMTACGKATCWNDGRLCGSGTTCNACCNGSSYWYGKAMTACGKEPCKSSGYCLKGTTCNRCCNGSSWKWTWSGTGYYCR